ncbi:phage portal protein [Pseudoalteromonas luteoviolacea]|uniref:Presumed portal vertex protein n=1 Tax=Pseudoalteromonas luteoviolacea NCIMB 1942 TaxID=1365253 RepID=A0A166Z6E7_9GAMM|nr:phage portal protein [Pseudoalteromonas luteoviolacea]KZN43985.1 Presumed portal vertex protein [Pseudoalteromonas luteoviolacea NCIMB 1942]
MAKSKKKADKQQIEAFTFGEPTPVLSQREIFDYLEAMSNGKYYEYPLSMNGLSRLYRAAVHHASAIQVKRNILKSCFLPHPKLSMYEFSALALDYLVFQNAYLQRVKSRLGNALCYKRMPAKFTRVGVNAGEYWWVPNLREETLFADNSIFHIKESDLNQEVYGVPDYVASMNSSLLNESATLFRRRYYENGSHAGFIMWLTDATVDEKDVTTLRKALKDSKGPGNFRNLFLHSPGGDKDGMRLIPVSEVAAKDEFLTIKNVSRDDQLGSHRVPPQLMGIIPGNVGGFGDVAKAAEVFDANELECIRSSLLSVNEWAGEEVIRFREYRLAAYAD